MTGADDVFQRVRRGRRSTDFDWLAGDASVEAIATTLSALANTRRGGTLMIGVTASPPSAVVPATISGVSDPLEMIDRILQAALSLTPALILPLPKVVEIGAGGGGKRKVPVVITTVPAGMPYVYACDGRYLHRQMLEDAPHNLPLEPRALRRLLIERGEITYETEVARGTTLDDLDSEKIQLYVARLGGSADPHGLLLKRGCLVRDENGDYLPTHAGILLFGRDVGSMIRGAEITAVRFAGETMGDTFSRQDIAGTLPDQIRRAETFLRDHLRLGVELQDTMARREQYEYPLEAARELVVNAVAHRDYSIQGDGIRLYLFKDRMEITSPGLLPGPVTVDNIRDERFSRNPVIVQVLADMGFIERLGYGVDRVMELMRQQNLREPEFCETGGGFKAMLYNANAQPAPAAQGRSSARAASATRAAALPITPLGAFRGVALNPRQETAIYFLTEGDNSRITNSELQRLHPDVHPETIRRDLSDLVTKKILNKMGEKRGSYYVLIPEETKSND